MRPKVTRVSIGQLIADGVAVRPAEAARIVRCMWRLAEQAGNAAPGVPSLQELKLDAKGRVSRTVAAHVPSSPTAADHEPLSAKEALPGLGHALHTLLSSAGNSSSSCGAGRMWIAADVAVGHPLARPDLPVSVAGFRPFESVEDFLHEIDPAESEEERDQLGDLFLRWQQKVSARDRAIQAESATAEEALASHLVTEPLTLDAVRQRREAAGITLSAIAERTKIPVRFLERLERGDFKGWPAGLFSRAFVRTYANEIGVDPSRLLGLLEPDLPAEESIEHIRVTRDSKRRPTRLASQSAAISGAIAGRMRQLASSPMLPAAAGRIAQGLKQGRAGAGKSLLQLRQDPADDGKAAPSATTIAAIGTIAGVAAIGALLIVLLLWRIVSGAAPAHSEPAAAVDPPAGKESAVDSTVPINNAAIVGEATAHGAIDQNTARVGTTGQTAADVSGDEILQPNGDLVPPPADAPALTTANEAPILPLVTSADVDAPAFSPSFASNGSAMFSHTGHDRSALNHTTASNGSVLEVVTIVDDGSRNYHVQVSPDGKQIAFDSDREGERGVYVASRDGSDVRRVSGAGYGAIPTWAPDGGRLVFVKAEPGDSNVWNLWLADVASEGLRRLTNHDSGRPWGGSWFPDGRRIAYTRHDALILLDTLNGESQHFGAPKPGQMLRTPAVSPDGSRIVFQVPGDGGWLLDVREGTMRRILDDASAEEFVWSPDGRRVAFHSRRDGRWGIWLMSADK